MNVENEKYVRCQTLNNDNLSGYLVVNIIISKGTMVQNYNEGGFVHFSRGTNSTNSTNSNGLQWNIFTYLKLQSPMDSNGLKWTQDSPTVSNYLINELQKAPMGSIGPHRSSIVIVNDLLICQQWTSKDYNELIWATMGSNGLQWAPMGSNGLQWTPIGSNILLVLHYVRLG